jgi:hypothetical protein
LKKQTIRKKMLNSIVLFCQANRLEKFYDLFCKIGINMGYKWENDWSAIVTQPSSK